MPDLSFFSQIDQRNFDIMIKFLHKSRLYQLMERRGSHGEPLEFDIAFRKISTGEYVETRAILTSWHSDGLTCNIMRVGENHPIKIYRCLIVKFNGIQIIA